MTINYYTLLFTQGTSTVSVYTCQLEQSTILNGKHVLVLKIFNPAQLNTSAPVEQIIYVPASAEAGSQFVSGVTLLAPELLNTPFVVCEQYEVRIYQSSAYSESCLAEFVSSIEKRIKRRISVLNSTMKPSGSSIDEVA